MNSSPTPRPENPPGSTSRHDQRSQRLRLYLVRPNGYEILAFALVCLLILPLTLGRSGDPLIWIAVAAFLTRQARVTQARYLQILRERVETAGGKRWTVAVNQVPVATLRDSDYAALRLSAYSDVRLYVCQAFTMLGDLCNALLTFMFRLPSILLWAAIALTLIAPDTVQVLLDAGKSTNVHRLSTLIASNLLTVLHIGLLFVLALVVGTHALAGKGGVWLVSQFEQAIQFRIRQKFGVPAVGELLLYRDDTEGEPHRREYASELAHLYPATRT